MDHVYAVHVLKLPDRFDCDQLRTNYKRMALLLHPDRRTLDKESANSLFSVLTESYKFLKSEIEGQGGGADADWITLRGQADSSGRPGPAGRREATVDFDVGGFNERFSGSRLGDDNDRGYTSWMQRLSPDAAAAQQKRRQGEERVRVKKSDAVVALREPEALPSSTSVPHSELGSGRVKDFGRASGSDNLSYTDYKVAHMTASCLIDPEIVKARHQFDSVEEYASARDRSHSTSMTPLEKAAIARDESSRASREDRRIHAMRSRDDLVSRHHASLNNVLT